LIATNSRIAMKKFCTFVLFFIPLFGFSQRLGVGIIIGNPTGFSGRYLLATNSAIAVNAGWSLRRNVGFHITGTYQYLFPGVIKDDAGVSLDNIAPHLGIGGRFLVKSKEADETEFNLGVRIGGGIEYMVSRFEIFLELYPVVNVIPATDFDIEGGLGVRFYF